MTGLRFCCSNEIARRVRAIVLLLASVVLASVQASRVVAAEADHQHVGQRKIVLIAGPKSHGPVGNGIHDYPWSVKLLKVMLDNSNVAEQVQVEYHLDGWPDDPATLDDADTIMVISDGRDSDLYAEALHFATEENLKAAEKQIQRGCGFLTFHFSTFAPDRYAGQILDWSGGYFDWETDGKRQWYSQITTKNAEVRPAAPDHPVSRGLTPFTMNEEFYFDLRFRPDDSGLTPLWVVPDLQGREPDGRIVAWAKERPDGGRGFGTTCGHFYENWKQDNFRRLILNALVWTAKGEVPEGGVESRYYSHAEITAALAGIEGTERAVVDDQPIKALILTGANHPAHRWQETTPAIKTVLERDPRMQVAVSDDPEVLATERLNEFDLLVLNYCNWEQAGLSDAAKGGFVQFLSQGGGLCIVHFANGAFHFSLPGAESSDWPEYRNICRRVWDHTPGKSGHDPYGSFVVEIENTAHPVTQDLAPFRTTDELYFQQQGDAPIEVLAKAHSSVTKQWEPMAFVYEYGEGRVLQTVLGHSADSIRNPGTATILHRGAAWVAGREPLTDAQLVETDEPQQIAPFAEGRFGKALDARAGGLFVAGREEYRLPPITVECWAKLDDAGPFNILVAQEPKASLTHWELFSMSGSGHLTAYLPGLEPDHVRSTTNICDGRWHHVAMIYEPRRVRLIVDGQPVADHVVVAKSGETVPGALALGSLATGELGCSGLIDEVRLTKGIREITAIPDQPLKADERTIGLWRFEAADDGRIPDESSLRNAAKKEMPSAPAAKTSKIEGHWGEDAVGVRWTETDSVDSRWDRTEIGSFLASLVPLPNQPTVNKGLSIRIGNQGEAAICYDTEQAAARAAWTGGFLKFDPTRYGLIAPPRPAGKFVFATDEQAGWSGQTLRYHGLHRNGNRVVLSYAVNGVEIKESPWWETHDGTGAVSRTIEVGPSSTPLTLQVLHGNSQVVEEGNTRFFAVEQGGQIIAVSVVGSSEIRVEHRNESVVVIVPPGEDIQRFKLLLWSGPSQSLETFKSLLAASPAPTVLDSLAVPGPAQWNKPIVTQGVLGDGDGPYVIDTLTLPFENPYGGLFFVGGHDFLPNGDVALCTVHGDVWIARGVDETLSQLTWKRFATGLFQPLGLRVVEGQVYVLGRDQITRLHDANGDDEADFYECFSNAHETSPGGHDYVAGLETDPQGNFYFVHATQGLVRVSSDGQRLEVVATGFRNPNGLSVGPDGTATVAPQEGEWTPGSCVIEVRRGGHYGYGGPKPTAERPLGYDPPLCWIPRRQDNSSGGQVWVTSERWGPLAGQLIHLSYGQCRMMLVPREEIDGQVQGGVVDFPLNFDSGVMRGRFSPHDGQLYVSGLKGWVSAAVQDGCLQRVRYTGRAVGFPASVRTMRNGLALTFTRSLDRVTAENPGSYHIEQWNYRYGPQYGSPEYRVSQPDVEGRDEIELASATLLDDGRTVFLEIENLRPVNQMAIRYSLNAEDGGPIRQTLAYTIHRIGSEELDPARLHRPIPKDALADDAADRLPGVNVRFEQNGQSDARSQRLVAFHIPAGTAPTTFLKAEPFAATFEGSIRVPLRGEYEFHLAGHGRARLTINDHVPLDAELAAAGSVPVPLDKGDNRFTLHYESPQTGDASLRLLWSSEEIFVEPVPPTALFREADDASVVSGERLRLGRRLFATHQCERCHAANLSAAPSLIPEHQRQAPDLQEAGHRLNPNWVVAWLLNPRYFRHDATMPQLLDPSDAEDRRKAADLAAYLASLAGPSDPAASKVDDTGTNVDAAAFDGEALYADLGCIACHRLTPAEEPDSYDRVSLSHVAAKYQPGALKVFLQQPHGHHVGSRMPVFGLSDDEAARLAAFLRRESTATVPEMMKPADPTRGGALFRSLRCNHCHAVDDTGPAKPSLSNVFAMTGTGGCLAETFDADSPNFDFTSEERDALRTYLAHEESSLHQETSLEASARLFESLRCGACHDRDDIRSPRRLLILEETGTGLVPESLPSLTWAGEKLKSEWTQELFAGDLGYRCRPSLTTRMPAFPEYAEVLAAGLAAEHGLSSQPSLEEPVDPQRAEIGKRLAGKETGLDCRQCHGFGAEQPLGDEKTLIAPGINFSYTRDRLRHEHFVRFVLDPPRYELETKMPKLVPDGRITKVREIYDGNAHRQLEALWHYIRSSPAVPPK